MLKTSNTLYLIILSLISHVKNELDIGCATAIAKITLENQQPKYICKENTPIGAGLESVAYVVSESDKEDLYVMKVARTLASVKEADPEIIHLSKLQDPTLTHVVKLYETFMFSLNKQHYIVEILEYAKNADLQQFIKKKPAFFDNYNALLEFSIELVLGLQEIHSKKIIHASVKAQNVIVTENLIPKYIDFNNAVENEKTDFSRGDHLFNAPEVPADRSETVKWGPAQDIYSLGVLFYYMAHGGVPFDGMTRALMRRALERGKFTVKKGLHYDYLEIIHMCMRRDQTVRSNLNTLLELIRKAKEVSQKAIKVLDRDMVANLDNKDLEEVSWYNGDPLLLVMYIGSGIAIIATLCLVVGCIIRKKRDEQRKRNDLYLDDEE